MLLKLTSRGDAVKELQKVLQQMGYETGPADGVFGEKTEDAVTAFQEANGLYADGIAGPKTLGTVKKTLAGLSHETFGIPAKAGQKSGQLPLERVEADPYGKGYNNFRLRADVAHAYEKVRKTVLNAGGILTSSGSMRDLGGKLNPNRSATSFHYVGRALDLFVWSGMVDAQKDPYVTIFQGDRNYRVFARASDGEQMTLDAATYQAREGGIQVAGRFVDLTALFEEVGFRSIRARRSFLKDGNKLGAEWWHFQYEEGLIPGVSTFGEELLRLYPKRKLRGTPPWKSRNSVFKVDWL